MRKVIIDSDWGGDVLQLACVLLSRRTEYKLLGATVTFGNASLRQNVENAGAILRLLGMDSEVPRFAGAFAPDGVDSRPAADDAHGRTGLGGVSLLPSTYPESVTDAVTFLIETIEREEAGSVVLVATGPQTNVARAIRRAPEVMKRLGEVRIMGGCVRGIEGYRVDEDLNRIGTKRILRRGNITEWAEFNFQQAPSDAAAVLNSGIPVVMFPMDCTHQLTFTPERESLLRSALRSRGELLEQLIGLLRAPERIDRQKFDSYPVMHDVHTTVSMLKPELYRGERGRVELSLDGPELGKTSFSPDDAGPHWVARNIVDPDEVFAVLLDAVRLLSSSHDQS